MTKISFYILKSDSAKQRQAFACRLAEKAYHQGSQVYIHTSDAEQSTHIDMALWSTRAESFVPHSLVDSEDSNDTPVLIGHGSQKPPRLMDVLINLNDSDAKPDFFSQFKRVAEIIDSNDDIKQAGRERFKFYKHCGYELDTHNI